ncbi:MAG: hypothetical protein IPJ19_09275 [Planctomycetes bacterium]|nr:hypothetical protein [Planctomycetota bacterium]
MRPTRLFSAFLLLGALAASAQAQSGLLDQLSPLGTASFSLASTTDVWQAQVRAGMSGAFEGVTLSTGAGAAGQSFAVRLRLGPGWNTTPVLFSTTAVKQSAVAEDIFVDMRAAGLTLNANDLFVVEIQGTGAPAVLKGTHTNPPTLPPYPEPMFRSGPNCFEDCRYRIAFQTWMVGEFTSLCFGDGSQALACPCSNSGAAGRGCENSASTGGARLSASGAATPDSVELHTMGELPTALTIFLQGSSQISVVPFGDGLRCTGGLLKRLYVKSAVGGAANAPLAGDPSVSAQSASLGDPIASGTSRWYQAYYRDANQSFCPAPTGSTYNISNAVRIDW